MNLSSTFRDSKWRIQCGGLKCKKFLIGIKFGTRGFLMSLTTPLSSKFRNSRGECNMVDQNTKSYFIRIKFASREFLGSGNF